MISWDFDYTLYNPHKENLIGNTYKLFSNMKKTGAELCITTYRYEYELSIVREFFPDIRIFATGRESKVFLAHSFKYSCNKTF